jgi:hypothetical protein
LPRALAGSVPPSAAEYQVTFQLQFGRGGGGLPAVIGLLGSRGNDGVTALRQGVAEDVFEFTRLVPAER